LPDERSFIQHALVLRRVDPDRGVAQFYSLIVEHDLFGTMRFVRNQGRIGTDGRELAKVFATELEARGRLNC
jgi:predicted DNA-binding WGR domain protein